MSFSVISQKFLIFWWVSKNFPFLTTWPRKRAPPKHYKNRGFSTPIFEKQLCATKRPFLDKKKRKFINSSYHFFLPFSSLSTTKNTKICRNHYFYCVLANLKKDTFPKFNLKQRNLKNPIFAPFFRKRLFLENWQITGHKKNTK